MTFLAAAAAFVAAVVWTRRRDRRAVTRPGHGHSIHPVDAGTADMTADDPFGWFR